MNVPVETPWGRFQVRASPHGSPRILETAKTHPSFVGIGLREKDGSWEHLVFVFKDQAGIDEFKTYLQKRDPKGESWFSYNWVTAGAKEDVKDVVRWII